MTTAQLNQLTRYLASLRSLSASTRMMQLGHIMHSPSARAFISNYTGRFAVYLSVEHVKINVHQQAVQAYGMWVEKVGKFYLFYILLTLFEAIAI